LHCFIGADAAHLLRWLSTLRDLIHLGPSSWATLCTIVVGRHFGRPSKTRAIKPILFAWSQVALLKALQGVRTGHSECEHRLAAFRWRYLSTKATARLVGAGQRSAARAVAHHRSSWRQLGQLDGGRAGPFSFGQSRGSTKALRADLVTAPTLVACGSPSLKTIKVGMPRILKRLASWALSSMLILAMVSRSPYSSANSCRIGSIILQGPHHSAQ